MSTTFMIKTKKKDVIKKIFTGLHVTVNYPSLELICNGVNIGNIPSTLLKKLDEDNIHREIFITNNIYIVKNMDRNHLREWEIEIEAIPMQKVNRLPRQLDQIEETIEIEINRDEIILLERNLLNDEENIIPTESYFDYLDRVITPYTSVEIESYHSELHYILKYEPVFKDSDYYSTPTSIDEYEDLGISSNSFKRDILQPELILTQLKSNEVKFIGSNYLVKSLLRINKNKYILVLFEPEKIVDFKIESSERQELTTLNKSAAEYKIFKTKDYFYLTILLNQYPIVKSDFKYDAYFLKGNQFLNNFIGFLRKNTHFNFELIKNNNKSDQDIELYTSLKSNISNIFSKLQPNIVLFQRYNVNEKVSNILYEAKLVEELFTTLYENKESLYGMSGVYSINPPCEKVSDFIYQLNNHLLKLREYEKEDERYSSYEYERNMYRRERHYDDYNEDGELGWWADL